MPVAGEEIVTSFLSRVHSTPQSKRRKIRQPNHQTDPCCDLPKIRRRARHETTRSSETKIFNEVRRRSRTHCSFVSFLPSLLVLRNFSSPSRVPNPPTNEPWIGSQNSHGTDFSKERKRGVPTPLQQKSGQHNKT